MQKAMVAGNGDLGNTALAMDMMDKHKGEDIFGVMPGLDVGIDLQAGRGLSTKDMEEDTLVRRGQVLERRSGMDATHAEAIEREMQGMKELTKGVTNLASKMIMAAGDVDTFRKAVKGTYDLGNSFGKSLMSNPSALIP